MPTAVLFVCLGNICRSPMAEAVFTDLVAKQNLGQQFPKIDSAGTAGYHVGEAPDSRSVRCCRNHGVPVNHYARQVSKKDFDDFDWILCMDESNLRDLKSIQPPKSRATVQLLGDFDPQGDRIIQDPYYGGAEGFEHNFQQCQRACQAFIDGILNKANGNRRN